MKVWTRLLVKVCMSEGVDEVIGEGVHEVIGEGVDEGVSEGVHVCKH